MIFSNKKPGGDELERPEPCPFCGHDKCIIEIKDTVKGPWAVRCLYCGARGGYSSTKEGALAKWNRRA